VAEQWLTFIEEMDPEIKILLCKNCMSDDGFQFQANNLNIITKLQGIYLLLLYTINCFWLVIICVFINFQHKIGVLKMGLNWWN
jgi:hypothetical protein